MRNKVGTLELAQDDAGFKSEVPNAGPLDWTFWVALVWLNVPEEEPKIQVLLRVRNVNSFFLLQTWSNDQACTHACKTNSDRISTTTNGPSRTQVVVVRIECITGARCKVIVVGINLRYGISWKKSKQQNGKCFGYLVTATDWEEVALLVKKMNIWLVDCCWWDDKYLW